MVASKITPHLLGMYIIHGKNSTKWAPGRAARVRRATKSLTALTLESNSDEIGGVSYVTDMTMDAAVRRKCLSHAEGWARRPEVSRIASVSCGVLKDSTTDLLRPSWAALRILRHLCRRQDGLMIAKKLRTESRNSGIPWLSHHRGFEQRQCCADDQSRLLRGGQAGLLLPSGN
jgi:hypothetical protein